MSTINIPSTAPAGPHLVRLGSGSGPAYVVIRAKITVFSRRIAASAAKGAPGGVLRFALLLYSAGRLYIRNLNGSIPLHVNGQQIHEAELFDGDILRSGDGEFRVSVPASDVPVATPPAPAELQFSGRTTAHPLDTRVTVIGTTASADVFLADASDSDTLPIHAVIVDLNGRHLLQDLVAAGTLQVNGNPTTLRHLCFGDIISVGGQDIRYAPLQPPGPVAPANALVPSAHIPVTAEIQPLAPPTHVAPDSAVQPDPELRPAARRRDRRIMPRWPANEHSSVEQSSAEVSEASDFVVPAELAPLGDTESIKPRGKMGSIALMLSAMAIAAAGVWSLVEPTTVLEGTIAFEPVTPTTRPVMDAAFQPTQESLIRSWGVRRRAMQRLERSQPGIDPTFLGSPRALGLDGQMFWEQDKETGKFTLILRQPSRTPDSDKARIDALLHAFYEANAAQPSRSAGIGGLREELLRTEVEGMREEVSYLRRRGNELQEELNQTRQRVLSAEQYKRLQDDVAKFRLAYQSALAARVRLEIEHEALWQEAPAERPAESTTKPGTSPELPVGLKTATANVTRDDLELEVRRQAEEQAALMLAGAERRLAGATAHRQTVELRRDQLGTTQAQRASAEQILQEKESSLGGVLAANALKWRATAPTQVRVSETIDPRGFLIAATIGVIATGFSFVFLRGGFLDKGRESLGIV